MGREFTSDRLVLLSVIPVGSFTASSTVSFPMELFLETRMMALRTAHIIPFLARHKTGSMFLVL
jgi:hypothetical protein